MIGSRKQNSRSDGIAEEWERDGVWSIFKVLSAYYSRCDNSIQNDTSTVQMYINTRVTCKKV